jgi:hypothetical protein
LDRWDVIANPAAHPGLLHSGQIQTWLESGADLNRDIIETVTAKLSQLNSQGKRQHVKSCDFFTNAIAEAKARRERGLPPPNLNGSNHENGRDRIDADTEYAARNITVEKGRITIGEDLRCDLRCDGYTDEQITLSLPRGLERAQKASGGRDTKPLAILHGIRTALSFIKQDAAKQSTNAKRFGRGTLRQV